MTKITLNNVGSLVDTTTAANTINVNSATIQAAFDNTLSRDGTTPNTMGATLDMNSNRIINLPDPVSNSEAVNLSTLNGSIIGTGNVPAGGTTGQSLIKSSNVSYATAWGTPVINLTGPITSVGTVTSVASQTGTGSTFVMSSAPTISGHPTIEGTTSTGATGTGQLVFNITPNLITPALGAAVATTINKVTITAPATGSTLTIPDGVTLTGPAVSGTAMTLGNTETVTGVKTFGAAGNVGKLVVAGTTSGTTVLNAASVASGTLTFPAATDVLVGKATTDTFTNKTLDSAGAGNVIQVGSVTLSKGQYPAETTTGNATAGNVGEYISVSVAQGSAVPLTTGVTANIISTLSLTAGDWDVQAMPRITGAATTTVGRTQASISLVSATNSVVAGCLYDNYYNNVAVLNFSDLTLPIPTVRISLSGTTTIFLVANVTFGVSTCSGYGFISARRAR